MKRFIISVLCVSVFFIGLGTMAERAGARLKSDEKALSIIRQARQAIGGDQAITAVRSMTIAGKTTKMIKAGDQLRAEPRETEFALGLDGKFSRTVKMGNLRSPDDKTKLFETRVNVVVVGKEDGEGTVKFEGKDGEFTTEDGKKVTVRRVEKTDGTSTQGNGDKIVVREIEGPEGPGSGERKFTIRKKADGDAAWQTEDGTVVMARSNKGPHEVPRRDDLLSTTLALLLSAPDGMDVNYTFSGESVVDGTQCNIVTAEFGGQAYKLFIGKSSNLPVMLSYAGVKMPELEKIRVEAPQSGEAKKSDMVFVRTPGPNGEKAEFQIRYSDYRNVDGILLPFKWISTVNDQPDETYEVTNYVINPADIAEKFQNQKVFVRTEKTEH